MMRAAVLAFGVFCQKLVAEAEGDAKGDVQWKDRMFYPRRLMVILRCRIATCRQITCWRI